MIQKEKSLLFKEICARFPYKVKFESYGIEGNVDDVYDIGFGGGTLDEPIINHIYGVHEIKLYLRPMSSMTEEEENEYRAINCYEGLFPCNEDALDYVLSHHFDYHGLIEKGFAIAVTEENNPYKE